MLGRGQLPWGQCDRLQPGSTVLPAAPVSWEGTEPAPRLRDESPRGWRCCTGPWQHCGSHRACSKRLGQSSPPPHFSSSSLLPKAGDVLAGPRGAAATGCAVGSAAGGRQGSCPAAEGCSPRPAWGQLGTGQVPRAKGAEMKLTPPSSGAKVGAKESQGRGREAVRTRKAAASVVNISHFNCFNDTLRDGCAIQRVP